MPSNAFVLSTRASVASEVYRESSVIGAKMALEKELETYKKNLSELVAKHEGKFVLIHDEHVVDTFSTYEDAIKAGYQRFKADPFLVQQVLAIEPVFFVSRTSEPLHEPI